MSSSLPFPLSHNRSYPSGGESDFEDQPSGYSYTPYAPRSLDYAAATARADTSTGHSSISGMFHHSQHDQESRSGHSGVGTGLTSSDNFSSVQDPYFQYHNVGTNDPQSRSDSSGFAFVAREAHQPDLVIASPPPSRSPERSTENVPGAVYPTSYTSSTPVPKARKDKPRIQLASDQPLTTQGKPRTRVYVACVQCRSRKIRCDGAKPMCHNCSRRTDAGEPCSYDPAPKRRGPDKTPGARQRSTVASGERPRRRPRNRDPVSPTRRGDHQARVQAQNAGVAVQQQQQLHSNPGPGSVSSTAAFRQETLTIINEGIPPPYNGRQQDVRPFRVESRNISSQLQRGQQQGGVVDYSQVRDTSYDAASHPPPSVDFAYIVHTSPTYINSAEKDFHEKAEQKEIIAAEPGLQFTRETWWDALLIQYGRMHHGTSVITDGLRKTISLHITGSLHALFRSAPHWLNFINLPRFFGTLLDPRTRNTLQPSLILSALAIATFFQSSESDEGLPGREKALTLREQAQGALEASLNAGWIDRGLVQASWLIAFFEISAHPLHCTDRVRSSMAMLDSLIRSLSLTTLDAHDPRVSIFPARLVPTVPAYSHSEGVLEDHPVSHRHHQSDPRLGAQECSCSSYTLGKTWPHVSRCAPLWSSTPAWIDGPESELRKEECRRLVWSALTLTASHSSYTAASSDIAIQQLFIMDPANYALLFPGESLGRIRGYPSSPSKDSVWALYIRTMLLWHSCLRMRGDASYPEAEKTQFAVSAWLELDNIEEALDKHSCGIERAFLFQGREILFNSRMCISFEFQRYIPQATANANLLLYHKKAEEWLTHQALVAERVVTGLHVITGLPTSDLSKRPFMVFWFMSQISRALTLWSCNRSLTLALDVAKAFLSPTEYLMELWPCPEQHRRYNMLRDKLTDACYAAGVPPPTPGVTIPSPVSLSR